LAFGLTEAWTLFPYRQGAEILKKGEIKPRLLWEVAMTTSFTVNKADLAFILKHMIDISFNNPAAVAVWFNNR
jgi:hypothetical protein